MLTKPAAHRFSYFQLCRAIDRFSPANKGGFGSVYHGQLLGSDHLVAVKLMNKLALTAPCDCVVSLLGFSFDRRRCLLLVYELMPNYSLQDVLLDRCSP